MKSKTNKEICGTCEYWTGCKNPVFDKNGQEKVDIIDKYGECQNGYSRFVDKKRDREHSCIRHSKWSVLI